MANQTPDIQPGPAPEESWGDTLHNTREWLRGQQDDVIKGMGQDAVGIGELIKGVDPTGVSEAVSKTGPAQAFTKWTESAGPMGYLGNVLGLGPFGAAAGEGFGMEALTARAGGRAVPALGKVATSAVGTGTVAGLQPTEHGTLKEHAENALEGAEFGAGARMVTGPLGAVMRSEKGRALFDRLSSRFGHYGAASLLHMLGIPWLLAFIGSEGIGAKGAGKLAGKLAGAAEEGAPKPMFSKGEFVPKDRPEASFKKGEGVSPSPDEEFGREPKFESGKGFEGKAGDFRPVPPPPRPAPGAARRAFTTPLAGAMVGGLNRGDTDEMPDNQPGWAQ